MVTQHHFCQSTVTSLTPLVDVFIAIARHWLFFWVKIQFSVLPPFISDLELVVVACQIFPSSRGVLSGAWARAKLLREDILGHSWGMKERSQDSLMLGCELENHRLSPLNPGRYWYPIRPLHPLNVGDSRWKTVFHGVPRKT